MNPPQIQYHNYLLLLSFMEDREFSRLGDQRNSALKTVIPESFKSSCNVYYETLQTRLRQWLCAQHRSLDENRFAKHLYDPKCLVAFGVSDFAGLVLLDDFDPLFSITADLNTSIEQVSLAFCPKISSLGLDEKARRHLRELHECFDRRSESHPSWSETPLVAISRLKSNAILSLGLGMRGQRALFRAIARKVSETLDVLHEHSESQKYRRAKEQGHAYLEGLPEGESRRFWYTIVDPQGAADTGVIFGCRNYSIAMAAILAIRSITMRDLYAEDASLQNALEAYSIHSRIKETLNVKSTLKDALCDNHALTTVYTTLCVDTETYKLANMKSGLKNVHGYVNLNTSLDVNPGHLPVIEKALATKFLRDADGAVEAIGRPEDFHFLEAGRNDMSIFRVGEELLRKRSARFVATSRFLKLNGDFFKHLAELSEKGARETGVLDVFTTLTVPIPRIVDRKSLSDRLCPEPGSGHVATLKFLTALRSHVCSSGDTSAATSTPVFDLTELDTAMGSIGVPNPLRYAIKYLYETYAKCIGDPYLLDCVLDLHDVFSTLYVLVTDILPTSTRLDKMQCDDMSSIVDALNNSLIHRIAMNGPKNETRDTAIDFRGGLNQIVHGIDVPIRTALELLRRRFANDGTNRRSETSRSEVSAITRLTFNPETTCQRYSIAENQQFCLAQMNVNVSHMCDPIECLYYFHEVAHLLHEHCHGFTEARRQYLRQATERLRAGDQHAADDISTMNTRVEEVYSGYVTLLFVFGWDVDTFLRHFLSRWSSSAYSSHSSDEDTLVAYTEILIWGFLISDPASLINAASDGADGRMQSEYDAAYSKDAPNEFRPGDGVVRASVRRFERMVDEYGCFFFGFDRLWNGKNSLQTRRYIAHQFVDVITRTLPLLREEWNRARDEYTRYARSAQPWRLGYDLKGRARLATIISGSLEDGDVFIVDRIRAALSGSATWAESDSRSGHLRDPDELMFVCDLLHAYADLCYDGIRQTQQMHLGSIFSNAGEGSELKAINSNMYLLQIGYPGVVSIDPEARSQHLLWRVITHKKLWDMSTDARAQRLRDLTKTMVGPYN